MPPDQETHRLSTQATAADRITAKAASKLARPRRFFLQAMRFLLESTLFKYAVLVAMLPLWLPFLRALWEDLNDSLREEGGLLGQPPSPEALQRMRMERRRQTDVMFSEPLPKRGQAARPSMARKTTIPGRGLGTSEKQRKGPKLRGGSL